MTTLTDDFLTLDSSKWQASNWSNGGTFLNSWEPSQIAVDNGALIITLESASPDTYISGEYQSLDKYSYGHYEIGMQAADAPGTVTGFFTYTGPTDGTQHDEIDIEILGDDPSQIQVNYWTNGVEHPTIINLGFNASLAIHTYAFDWQQDSIRWYVDGELVHTETGSAGALPTTSSKLMLNLWATTQTSGWSSDAYTGQTATIEADYIKYDAIGRTVIANSRGISRGSDADEILPGGAGAVADRMFGGNGDDTYIVDNKRDQVTEKTGGGNDTVQAGISFRLGKNIENLMLTGTTDNTWYGTGNELENVLTGDDGNNLLNGAAGMDTYIGGNGNDTYVIDTLAETAITETESGGDDTIRLKIRADGTYTMADYVENLLFDASSSGKIDITGNAQNNTISGNQKNNTLTGLVGDDTLNGGKGKDTLIGGDGVDTFVFDTAIGKNNVDYLTDFASGTDKISLDKAIFTALAGGAIQPDNFVADAGVQAWDINDYLLFDTASGALYYDADGSGSARAIQFAMLIIANGTELVSLDFV